MKADLHFHSIYSDGHLSPKELVSLAKEKGLDYIALTDHDSIKGVDEITKEASNYNIKVIPAVEISTKNKNESIHVLAYFKSLDDISDELKSCFSNMYHNRYNRLKQFTENINNLYNLGIDFEEIVRKHPYNLERPHLAEEISLKLGISKHDAYEKYLYDDCPGYIASSKLSTEDAVKLVKDSNGICVLAHPYQYKKNNPIVDLLIYDFDGIEVFYAPNKDIDKMNLYYNYAKDRNMVITGGTDFHYFNDPRHETLGNLDYKWEYFKELLERLSK